MGEANFYYFTCLNQFHEWYPDKKSYYRQ